MAYVVKDKEREIVGPSTTEIETGGKKFVLTVEGSFKRNKGHVMCDDCDKQCIREEKLGKHGRKTDKECGNLTCPNCQKIFTEYPYTTKDIGPIQEQIMFSCTICSEGHTGRDQLKCHAVTHPTVIIVMKSVKVKTS